MLRAPADRAERGLAVGKPRMQRQQRLGRRPVGAVDEEGPVEAPAEQCQPLAERRQPSPGSPRGTARRGRRRGGARSRDRGIRCARRRGRSPRSDRGPGRGGRAPPSAAIASSRASISASGSRKSPMSTRSVKRRSGRGSGGARRRPRQEHRRGARRRSAPGSGRSRRGGRRVRRRRRAARRGRG